MLEVAFMLSAQLSITRHDAGTTDVGAFGAGGQHLRSDRLHDRFGGRLHLRQPAIRRVYGYSSAEVVGCMTLRLLASSITPE
jgi:hypothetical protein